MSETTERDEAVEAEIAEAMGAEDGDLPEALQERSRYGFNESDADCDVCGAVPGTEHDVELHEAFDADDGGYAVLVAERMRPAALEATDESERRAKAQTEAEAEAESKKLAKLAGTYSGSVVKLLGDDLGGWLECELCNGFPPGLRPPVPVDEDRARKVRAALGMADVANYKQVDAIQACDTCGGLGAVLTGSKVSGHETRRCHSCQGRGYSTTLKDAPAQPGVPYTPPIVDDESLPLAPPPDADPWGRPPTDPLYGVMPGYER